MEDEAAIRRMLRHLFSDTGHDVSEDDLQTVCRLRASFARQRAKLTAAVKPETEPMIIPPFDRGSETEERSDDDRE